MAKSWKDHHTGYTMACGHTDPWIRFDDHHRPCCILCYKMPRTHQASITVVSGPDATHKEPEHD